MVQGHLFLHQQMNTLQDCISAAEDKKFRWFFCVSLDTSLPELQVFWLITIYVPDDYSFLLYSLYSALLFVRHKPLFRHFYVPQRGSI